MLDRLLATLNKPINKYTPPLNSLGQSKLTEYILQFGWKWSLSQLNEKATTSRTVEWTTFEGASRGSKRTALKEGVYYGQTVDGKRDGLGIVYCTDTIGDPFLFECEWKEGTPVTGRYIWIYDNKWRKREGTLD